MLPERRRCDELMDDPALAAETYHAVLADLAKVNRTTFAHRPTLAFLARAVRGRKRFRLLDVGFGDGDMLRIVARWAKAHGMEAELVGIDLNTRSVAAAAPSANCAIASRLSRRSVGWRCSVHSSTATASTRAEGSERTMCAAVRSAVTPA